MEPISLLSILPNLSIAAVAIVALVYVTITFLRYQEKQAVSNALTLKEQADAHRESIKAQSQVHHEEVKDGQLAIRSLEKEVRENILAQLSKNTQAFERVMDHLNHD